jgi:hypothetical protein
MDPKPDQTHEVPQQAEQSPAPKKRFQIVKLEERIAPGKGGGNGNDKHFTKHFCVWTG